ncbi:MAG TPA: MerR family transcriptional regulator [Novosphingobium sp.]|nr:MerR family transcriptional regulator [Novosphingobium sp.]
MRDLEARTGVNRETIRVFFREGLLPEPSRPARNVADYGEEHVRAIQAIRKLQHDLGMTLPQIKSVLSGQAPRRTIGATAFNHLEELVSSRVGVEQGLVSIESMREQNPMAASDAEVLDRIGIVELIAGADGAMLSLTDAGLVNIWGRMRAVGFDEEHGFPPEILDYYVEAAEYVAGREAQIFLAQVEGRMGEDEAAAMLEFALPAMLNFFGIIRQKAFLRNIGDRTKKGSDITIARPGSRKPRRKAS